MIPRSSSLTRPPRSLRRAAQLALLLPLLARSAAALQPPPRAPPPRALPSLTARLYASPAAAAAPTLSVRACDAAAAGQTQAFALNASTRALALADGRCLLRSGAAPGGVSAGACAGAGAAAAWSLAPCAVPGCATGSNESLVLSALDGQVIGVPGAVGPAVAMWTVDSPTGACHNELWAFNASDATLRSLCLNQGDGGPAVCPPGPAIFGLCLTVVEPPPPPPPPPPCTLRPRAACHVGAWDRAPAKTPSGGVVDAPLLGNGDLGAGLSAAAAGGAVWWLGKSDLWATNTVVDSPSPSLHSDTFYTSIGAGSVAVTPLAAAAATGFAATQDLASASVAATLSARTAAGAALNLSLASAVVAADENTLIVRLSFSSDAGAPELFNISVAQTTIFSLPLAAGVLAAPALAPPLAWAAWASKSGVAATANSLLLMPCDTHTYVIAPSTNVWSSDAGTRRLRLANGTAADICPALVDGLGGGATKVSIDACGAEGGPTDWRLVPAPAAQGAPPGALQLQLQGSAPPACAWASTQPYHNSGGLVTAAPCSSQTGAWWTWDEAAGLLHFNSTQCLAAVPPNVNVTVAVAASVFVAASGAPVALVSSSSSSSSGAAEAAATVRLLPGTDYLLIVCAPTNRDFGGADPLEGALAMLGNFAGAPDYAAARSAAHVAFWASFWSASEVFLGERRQLLEGFYYGAQYLLGSTARVGKVAPGLWGVFNFEDAAGWNGDMTIDYNFEANYYGACSSNRCDLIRPYADSVGSEWHLDVSRKRASSNWLAKGSAGGPGQTSQSMTCAYMDQAYEDPHICPNSTAGGYRGLEMTTHIGPYPGLYYFSDLSLRVVSLMSAMPFIELADYSADADFLLERAYPFVDEVADFFLSYVTRNEQSGAFDVLNSCAQEICGGGPDGEDNPHHDLAFLEAALRTLLRWSAQLGVDADKRPQWQGLLDGLAPLPTGTHAGAAVWLEANDTQANFLSNAGAFSIVYYAALHPAQTVSLSNDDEALLATAWATVEAVNAVNSYRPVNGLCMAWPPATRVAGSARAAGVLDAFEAALLATMNENFYPDVGGGGVEQFGATEAVNSALLQSQEGFIRLFAMWPPDEVASFSSLRARGGFLVSAAFAGGAVVAPVSVLAAGGPGVPAAARNCSVLDPFSPAGAPPPWPPLVVRVAGGGAPVAVVADPAWSTRLPVWQFLAESGEGYEVFPAGTAK